MREDVHLLVYMPEEKTDVFERTSFPLLLHRLTASWKQARRWMQCCEQGENVPKTAQGGLALGQAAAQSLNIITACLSCSTAPKSAQQQNSAITAGHTMMPETWGGCIEIWDQVLVNQLRHAAQRSAGCISR